MTSSNSVTAPVIDVRLLVKSYGDVAAVAGIDLRIEHGEVFALLGPNGAGKTTTVEILEGYRRRDSGEVKVLGLDPQHERPALKPRVGIVLQSTGVDRYLTVRETLSMYASYYPRPREVDDVIDLVGLRAKRDTRVTKLSGGQQRRLDVAIALVGDPDLLFLDEPTTGFDPSARHEAWELVKGLSTLGKTVLLTTHYMDEAQYLADRVAVMARGRIVAEGTPDTLGGRDVVQPVVRFRAPVAMPLPAEFAAHVDGSGVVELRSLDLARTLFTLSSWATEHGVHLEDLQILRPSLEDVYLRLTEEPTAEAVLADGVAR